MEIPNKIVMTAARADAGGKRAQSMLPPMP
jgi:hypothetical protein